MCAKQVAEERTCPGERYSISPAICHTRQRNQYPKCLLCPHRSAEAGGTVASDPKVAGSVFRPTRVLGRVPAEVNEYVIRKVGVAAAQFLRAEAPSGSHLLIACDARDNSRSFSRVFSEGANRGGMNTLSLGMAPPELLTFVLGTYPAGACTGAAFIGGGNYADNVNGVRLWLAGGTPVHFGAGLEKVALIARRLRTGLSRLPGESGSAAPLGDYASYVRKFAPRLSPLKVLVDGGYGAAGRVLAAVCAELPLEVVPLHFEPDGHNPFLGRRFPCTTLVAQMREAVPKAHVDLGMALDFTGERAAFFDERGELLRHDAAAGLISSEALARSPGGCVVYDLRSTAALRARVQRAGGQPAAAPTSSLAFAQVFRRNDAVYGADLGGLHYFKDFFRSPSPAVALLMTASCLSRERKPASALAADLNRFSQSGEVLLTAPTPEAAQKVVAGVRDEFQKADRDLIDGVTVRLADWWFNLRQRGETAELYLNVEGRTDREQRKGRQTVEKLVSRLLVEGRP
jgi:phosphomannomutase